MTRLKPQPESQRITIAAAQTALPFPPTVWGTFPAWSQDQDPRYSSAIGAVELELWAAGAVDLTVAELLGGALEPLAFADVDLTSVDAGANTLTKNAHGLQTGDGPITASNAGGALPGGLAPATPYFVIRDGANTVKLASSRELALAGTAIDLTSAGTGTHTLSAASSFRLHWLSLGLLGHAEDGAIALAAQRGYHKRVELPARVFVLAIAATLSTPEAVSAAAWPLV